MRKFKNLLISFLVAACAVCIGVAFAACSNKGDKSGSKYGYGEEGVYYYSADSETDYLMSLQSGTYMISVGGVSGYSGTYSYDAEAGTVSFTSNDGETFEASFADDAMQLAISGQPYTFLRSVNETVTFMDGNSVVGTRTVTYGKSAEAIDGEKSGYIFIGWYEDAAFTTPYKFNTAVTGDTTLYAYYIEEDSTITNFDITYISDGKIVGTAKTQNGMALEREMPEVEGILGWWVSDTNNEDELTYKYDGQVLKEATNLYAVKDTALGASVYGDRITWEAQVSSVTIIVDGAIVTSSATGNAYSYDMSALGTGGHTVEVSASGYGTENLVYVVNGLARVSNFSVYGTTLVYNRVENAQYYCISVTCANPAHDHTMVYNGNTLTYDFSNCEMGPDGITFTVYAYGTGYETSVSETFVYALILDDTTVKIDSATDTASWTAVSGATGYEVYVNGELVATTTGTEYSLKYYDRCEEGETIGVQVKPVAPGYYSEISAAVSYAKTTLRAPEITEITDYYISWTEVEGAFGYEVSINGYIIDIYPAEGSETAPTKIYVGNGNSSDEASDYYSYIIDGTNVISVAALSSDGTNNSQFSGAVYATELTMSPVLSYKDGVISWTAALAAETYFVEYEGTITEVAGAISFDITFTHSGENTVKVYFDGDSYADITVYACAIVFDARGGENVDTMYVVKGDTVELPESALEGYEFTAWYTLPDLTNFDQDSSVDYSGDGMIIHSGSAFDASTDQVYYAFYTPKAYTLTLVVGNGKLVDESGSTVATYEETVYYNRTFTLPVAVPTDGAQAFAGWYDLEGHSGNMYVDEKGNNRIVWNKAYDATLYAGYYTVLSFSTTTYAKQKVATVSKGGEIDSVTEVTIPEEYTISGKTYPVGYIGSSAFNECRKLQVINIPDTIMLITTTGNGHSSGSGAFSSCDSLTAVNIYATGDSENTTKEITYYSDDAGALYQKSGDGVSLIYYPYARTGKVTIPAYVSNENEYAYSGNNLEKVYRAVTGIYTKVFYNNNSMESVVIPYTVKEIEYMAFDSAKSLEKVVFEEAEDGYNASLTIGDYVFRWCSALASVTLPSHLVSFGSQTFYGCEELTGFEMARDGSVYSVRDGYLCSADGHTIMYAPYGTKEFASGSYITAIGENAFEDAYRLETVVISEYIQTIGAGAFSGRWQMTSLTFEGKANSVALTIGDRAFYGCSALTGVTLPANLVSLGDYAFGNCRELVTVKVDAATGNLDYATGAFESTSGEYYVETVIIGANVGVLNINAVFGGNVSTVELDTNNTNYTWESDVLYYADMSGIAFFPSDKTEYTTTAGLKIIQEYVFQNRTNLTSVTIGASVEEIGVGAFMGCTNLSSVTFTTAAEDVTEANGLVVKEYAFANCTSLTQISMPDRLTAVCDAAFSGCTGLTSFTITKNLTQIGSTNDGGLDVGNVFSGCTALQSIDVAEGNTAFASEDGMIFNYDKTELFYASKSAGSTAGGVVTIPGTVKKIWAYAFDGNNTMTELKFDNDADYSDLEIGEYAFTNCTALATLNLPEGLGRLEEGTFSNCTSLTEVSVPASVTYMAVRVFNGDSSLTELKFADRASASTSFTLEAGTGTSNTALGTLSALKTLSFPEGMAAIPDYTIANNTSVAGIEIPASVTTIGTYAFRAVGSSSNTVKVTFAEESNLKSIGTYAFYSCVFESIDLGVCEQLAVIDNYAFSGATLGTLDLSTCTSLSSIGTNSFEKTSGNVTFPGSLKDIGNYAFRETKMTHIELEGAETVGNGAFYYSSVQSVALGNLKSLGSSVFDSCRSLASVSLTAYTGTDTDYGGLTIGDYCFYNCIALSSLTIPDGTVSIGNYCFYFLEDDEDDDGNEYEANKITNISIPSSVKTIGNSCFYHCSDLETLTFAVDAAGYASLESIGNYAFSGAGITEIEFPKSGDAQNLNVIQIGTQPLADCRSLTKIVISDSISDIGGLIAAVNSTSGFSLELPQDSENYSQAAGTSIIFNKEQTAIVFIYETTSSTGVLDLTGTSLTEIGAYAFQSCNIYTEIKFPDSLQSIGNYAFSGCAKLATVQIPATIVEIGDYAFNGCTGLTTVTFTGTASGSMIIGSHAFYNDNKLATFAMPGTVVEIGESAFYSCTALSGEIDLSNVASIGNMAFYKCTGITKVTLGEGLTALGDSSYGQQFDGCTALAAVVMPSTLTSLGRGVFANCTLLKSIDLQYVTKLEGLSTSSSQYATFYKSGLEGAIDLSDNTGLQITGSVFQGCNAITKIILPGSVTSIPAYMFADCSGLQTVEFKGAVTSVGAYAFYRCSALTDIDVSQATSFANYAFQECTALTEVDVSGATSLSGANSLFYKCSKLETIILNEDLTEIPNGMFSNCSALAGIDLPSGLTSLGGTAFEACTSLVSMTIPEGVTAPGTNIFYNCSSLVEVIFLGPVETLSSMFFYGCTSLVTVDLPLTLTKIDNYAFYNCTSLAYVGIPAGVKSIGNYAFQGCTSLTSIIIPEEVTSIGTYVFSGCTALEEIWIGSGVTTIGGTCTYENVPGTCAMYIVNTTESGLDPALYGFIGTVYYYFDANLVKYTEDGLSYAYNYWYVENGGLVIVGDYVPDVYTAGNGYVLFNADLDAVVGLYLADGGEETGFAWCVISSCTAEDDGTYTVVVGEDETTVYTVTLTEDGSAATIEVAGTSEDKDIDDTEEDENP